MKILVTGSAGFIGSQVSEALLRKGHSIVGIDDLNNYYSPEIKEKNVSLLCKYSKFKFYKADIRKAKLIESIFRKGKFDAVIHLAARAGVRPSIQKPILYEETDIIGTTNILNSARDMKVKKIVMASSSSVYGGNKKIPFSETDDVSHPISPYAACKRADELIAYTYHKLYGMNITCLRFFTVYGPRGRPDMAVYTFTKQISQGKPIEMYGNGNTKRDYTFIDDIVAGILASLEKCKGYEIYNLGNNHPVQLKKLISVIEKNVGKKARIARKPIQPGDVPLTYADLSKSRKSLGFKPKTSIEQGIKKFVEWYKKENKI